MKQVFLSYARLNIRPARKLFDALCADASIKVWFDRNDLLPGMRWRPAIRKAIRESRYFIALLSRKAVTRRGFRNEELREAVAVMREFPDGQIFLIPTRLDECQMPIGEIEECTYADLFPDWRTGVERLRQALGIDGSPPRRSRGGRAGRPGRRARAGHHYRIALVDLDSRVPGLKRIASGLNGAQQFFGFTPATLRAPGPAKTTIGGRRQFYVDGVPADFYARIAPLKVDFAVCLTDRYIAFDERGSRRYDYITSPSPVEERVMFVSHALVEDSSERARVSYESAIAFLVTAQLVAHFLDLDYHRETRNCPMDFDDNLEDLTGGLLAGRFCAPCRKRLGRNPALEAAVRAMIEWGR